MGPTRFSSPGGRRKETEWGSERGETHGNSRAVNSMGLLLLPLPSAACLRKGPTDVHQVNNLWGLGKERESKRVRERERERDKAKAEHAEGDGGNNCLDPAPIF